MPKRTPKGRTRGQQTQKVEDNAKREADEVKRGIMPDGSGGGSGETTQHHQGLHQEGHLEA